MENVTTSMPSAKASVSACVMADTSVKSFTPGEPKIL